MESRLQPRPAKEWLEIGWIRKGFAVEPHEFKLFDLDAIFR